MKRWRRSRDLKEVGEGFEQAMRWSVSKLRTKLARQLGGTCWGRISPVGAHVCPVMRNSPVVRSSMATVEGKTDGRVMQNYRLPRQTGQKDMER